MSDFNRTKEIFKAARAEYNDAAEYIIIRRINWLQAVLDNDLADSGPCRARRTINAHLAALRPMVAKEITLIS